MRSDAIEQKRAQKSIYYTHGPTHTQICVERAAATRTLHTCARTCVNTRTHAHIYITARSTCARTQACVCARAQHAGDDEQMSTQHTQRKNTHSRPLFDIRSTSFDEARRQQNLSKRQSPRLYPRPHSGSGLSSVLAQADHKALQTDRVRRRRARRRAVRADTTLPSTNCLASCLASIQNFRLCLVF